MNFSETTTEQLMRDLCNQLSTSGCHTISCCPMCEARSRGGNACKDCLLKELRQRNVPEHALRDIQSFVLIKDDTQMQIDALIDWMGRKHDRD